MADLPKWAQNKEPVDSKGACRLLGVSPRKLIEITNRYPHYERRGRKKVFYPEHIELMREALRCQNSNLKAVTEYGMPSALSPDNAYEKALELATAK